MLFTSPVFVLVFLPMMIAVYALTPPRFRKHVICFFNVTFYVLSNLKRPICILLLLMCAAFAYCAAFAVRSIRKTGVIVFAVSVCVLILAGLRILSMSSAPDAVRYFPVGASFYLLAVISCVVDVYRGDAPPPASFADALLYITYFPVMIAGPVIRYKDFFSMTDPEHIHISSSGVACGIQLFVLGFIKRVAIAASLDEAYIKITTQIGTDTGENLSLPVVIILGALVLGIVYYSFSGYSDMARGISLILGIPLAGDFGSCLLPTTVTEYAENFMNSLYRWFLDYVTIPIKKRGKKHTGITASLAAPITFLCIIFWFRASVPVLIAMLPMMLLTWIDSRFDTRKLMSKNILTRTAGRILTLAVISGFWVLIRSQNVGALADKLRTMTLMTPLQSYSLYLTLFNREFFLIGIMILIVRYPVIHGYVSRYFSTFKSRRYEAAAQWTWSILLMISFFFVLMYMLPQNPQLATTPFVGITL